jgi:2'-hydroxyisoflavone reductase
MRLLVLGGSSFVGRALVEEGLARGWAVTTFNRGTRPPLHADVETIAGDRLVPADLRPLTARDWDVVVDTWSGIPRAVRDSASALAGRAERYALVSSASVYAPPPPIDGDEHAPKVTASPDAEDGDYPERKRGAELALLAAFGDRALAARAGTILGPHENVGRLPWWLARVARGGAMLAPGPRDLPLQFVDARDLAQWLLDAAAAGRSGPYNVASRRGHATMGTLLDACVAATGSDAELVWMPPGFLAHQAIEPWSELPIWIPPDHPFIGLLAIGVERVHAAGLRTRPFEQTVADTWSWMAGFDELPPPTESTNPVGLPPEREQQVLAAWRAYA